MRDRLEIIYRLLSDDGSLWITIDDNEAHYLKVLCDEIFGRTNFVASVIWRSTDNSNNDAKQFSIDHNYVIVYSKNPEWITNKLNSDAKRGHFKNPDNDPRGPWFDGNPLNSPKPRPNLTFDLIAPNGNVIKPPKNGWRWSRETINEKMKTGEIRFNENFTNIRRRTYLGDMKGLPPSTLWAELEETGHNRQAKYELKNLFPDREVTELFGTPKPEKLIQRILEIATTNDDLILDSFAGSGTTGAVAHKMGLRWIMVELGEHCYTDIIPRLQKVVDGEDQGGISQIVGWEGGGGFRYYRLAPSLLLQDDYGQWVINKDYNAEMLAAAICKLEGFSYAPSADHYWQHGYSTEHDFVYVTTQSLTAEQLQALSDEVGHERTLLVCCAAFRGDASRFSNLTVKKIPKMVLQKCEWGHDDYSLNVENLPQAPKPVSTVAQAGLFGDEDTSNNKSGGAA
jgi:adenine-specific DNA-methyltransferase